MLMKSMGLRATVGVLLGVLGARAQTYVEAFPGMSFSRPIWLEEVPGKAGHFAVLEQGGAVQIVRKEGEAWSKSEFVRVTVSGGTATADERGLLGIAFHPQFAVNRRYFLYYVAAGTAGAYTDVLEERLADTTLIKDSGTPAKPILGIPDPFVNHNGGTIGFGKDGYLYLGTGDGGNFNDPNQNGQNTEALLGKMLRLDVDAPSGGRAYGIPADNPFAAGGGAPEVYAWGLRNPYRWAFDPVTGDQWVADVGETAFEEVNLLRKGGNYGWDVAEGLDDHVPAYEAPVFTYGRGLGGCIIGGFVFRGDVGSRYYGYYLVADYGSRNVWGVKAAPPGSAVPDTVKLAPAPGEPRGFGKDAAGNLYIMAYSEATGKVYQLSGTGWTAGIRQPPSRPGQGGRFQGRLITGRPGARLDPGAFAAGSELRLHALDGTRLGLVTAGSPVIPPGLPRGLYLLHAGRAGGSVRLLVQ